MWCSGRTSSSHRRRQIGENGALGKNKTEEWRLCNWGFMLVIDDACRRGTESMRECTYNSCDAVSRNRQKKIRYQNYHLILHSLVTGHGYRSRWSWKMWDFEKTKPETVNIRQRIVFSPRN